MIEQFLKKHSFREVVSVLIEEYAGALFRNWPGPEGFFFRYMLSKLIFKKVDGFCFIYPGARLVHTYGLSVGKLFNINTGAHIDARGGITIGNYVAIGPNAVIVSSNHTWANPDIPFLLQGHVKGPVTIGHEVWIGANTTILPNVQIADGTIVAAGAVVTKNTEPNTIVGGIPAVKIGEKKSNKDDSAQ
jgi:acetyltransferase-like isoleucine patch superfamily enzyme